MLGGADNTNGELPSYITGVDTIRRIKNRSGAVTCAECSFLLRGVLLRQNDPGKTVIRTTGSTAPRTDREDRKVMNLPSECRIWLVAGMTDMRKSFNGLGEQVQSVLNEKPHSTLWCKKTGLPVKCLSYP